MWDWGNVALAAVVGWYSLLALLVVLDFLR